ncbi:MAG: hypothetical protein HOQ10_16850 [Frateuria sp.]|nr:hypothetical protein [Frateuria sp.]
MNKTFLASVATICVLLLAACSPTSSGALPRADLQFSIVQQTPCADCKEMEQAGTHGQVRMFVAPPFAVAQNVRAIRANSGGGQPFIDFRFAPEAADRIEAATSRNTGNLVAIVVGNQVLSVTRLAEPFSDSMRMSGLSAEEHRALYFAVIQPGT